MAKTKSNSGALAKPNKVPGPMHIVELYREVLCPESKVMHSFSLNSVGCLLTI